MPLLGLQRPNPNQTNKIDPKKRVEERSIGRRSATGSSSGRRLAIKRDQIFRDGVDCCICCCTNINRTWSSIDGFLSCQLEEEARKSTEAQRRHQEEALAAAAAEAARMTELAAAASARAAAADAVREAVEAAEQDEFKRKAQKLKVCYILV